MDEITRADMNRLKLQWTHDPSWDIEETEGFETYHNELLSFRKEMEAKWEHHRIAMIQARAKVLNCSIELAEYILNLEDRLKRLEQR